MSKFWKEEPTPPLLVLPSCLSTLALAPSFACAGPLSCSPLHSVHPSLLFSPSFCAPALPPACLLVCEHLTLLSLAPLFVFACPPSCWLWVTCTGCGGGCGGGGGGGEDHACGWYWWYCGDDNDGTPPLPLLLAPCDNHACWTHLQLIGCF